MPECTKKPFYFVLLLLFKVGQIFDVNIKKNSSKETVIFFFVIPKTPRSEAKLTLYENSSSMKQNVRFIQLDVMIAQYESVKLI